MKRMSPLTYTSVPPFYALVNNMSRSSGNRATTCYQKREEKVRMDSWFFIVLHNAVGLLKTYYQHQPSEDYWLPRALAFLGVPSYQRIRLHFVSRDVFQYFD